MLPSQLHDVFSFLQLVVFYVFIPIVHHLFCASTEDEMVRDIASSLPYQSSTVDTYKIVNGHSHMSIVNGTRKEVLDWLDLHR